MSLEDEIRNASKKVVKDGYDMSVGELMSLYQQKELFINPKYQRYFPTFRTSHGQFLRISPAIVSGAVGA